MNSNRPMDPGRIINALSKFIRGMPVVKPNLRVTSKPDIGDQPGVSSIATSIADAGQICANFALAPLPAGHGMVARRRRPYRVRVCRNDRFFGGDWPSTPAWANVDNCSGNCSFVSGEAAAFWLVALAFIAPRPLRLPVFLAALTFAAAVSVARIAFGAHYLSDVVIAWTITLVVVAIGRWIILDRRRAGTIDAVVAGALQSENRTTAISPKQDDRCEN